MAGASKVVPYLDIPFQHCVPRILASMRRIPEPADAERLIDLIRSIVPEIALRTSLMVGYPDETAEDFESLCHFVQRVRFDHVGVFAFSPEPGTRAAKLPMQVDEQTREERRQTLMEIQGSISRRKMEEKVGKVLPVLIEGFHPETELLLAGRLASQAPEVDGSVLITSGIGNVGDIALARITAAHDYDVEAGLLDD
jgi:ribosomal protein S12 methylthiotransferase